MIKILNSWIIWFPAALFYFYQFMLRVSPSVLKDDLMREFSLNAAEFGLLSSFYYFGYCALQMPIGLICDYFGPRKLLTFAILLCCISTIVFGMAESLMVAQIARLFMGVGSACAFLGTMKLGTLWFPLKKLPLVTSFTMILGTIGANFGGMPMRILANEFHWRRALFIVGGIGVFIAILVWFLSKDKERQNKNSDEYASIFSGLKIVLKNPQVWLSAIFGFLLYSPLSVFADLWGTSFIEALYHIPPEEASSYINLIYIGLGLSTFAYAFAISRNVRIKTALIFTSFSVAITFSLILFMPDIPLFGMMFLLFLLGALISGEGLVFSHVCACVPVKYSGFAISFVNMFTMLSGLIMQPMIGKILDFLSGGIKVNDVYVFEVGHYKVALLVIAVCVSLSVFITFFFKTKNIENK